MDRLEEMRTFVGVVEAGSITGAAERLGIAKSAVSRRLADLEERLSVQLFRRTTRRLDLTDTGRSFYERCLRILADVEEAELAVSQEHGDLRGRLRVAVPLSFGLNHLGPAIDAFLRTHPGIEFDLDLNDRQVDLLAEGFDLAVRIADLEDSTLIARRLAPVRHVVCASPAYLAEHGTPRQSRRARRARLPDLRQCAQPRSLGVHRSGRPTGQRAGPSAVAGQQRGLPAPGGGGRPRHRPGAELHPLPVDRRTEAAARSSRTSNGRRFTPMRSIPAPDTCPGVCGRSSTSWPSVSPEFLTGTAVCRKTIKGRPQRNESSHEHP